MEWEGIKAPVRLDRGLWVDPRLIIGSLGLRIGEGTRLQVSDIDSQRMFVHIHQGKGNKDRYIPLPKRTLQI
ncbi:MAG TPA: hypothetical protein ENN17_11835, partial [bacterium]|nr:hypothetical protein [bacterium]